MSPRCGCQDVVSQLLPRFLHLLVSRPVVAKMWSPSCLPHVVSQVLSPSCFQRFYTCCLVFHLSPRCGVPVVSHMWFPRCCLPVVSNASTLVVQSSTCLPDVVSQLSPTCGFLDVVSQSRGFELFSRSFADVVSLLSSTSFRCGLPVVSQIWFLAVVSLSGCCLVVFDLSPTYGLSVVS